MYDAAGKLVEEYSTALSQEPQVAYLTSDSLGTPRINTGAGGAVIARHDYHPFGEEISTSQRTPGINYGSDEIRKQFTGYERDDETGLDFAQARYFESGYGRFSSPDDFLNDTKVVDPASWNLYVYVRNNPLRYTDPLGKEIDGTNLSEEQRQTLINEWKKITGYKDIHFDSKTNKLVVNIDGGIDQKADGTSERILKINDIRPWNVDRRILPINGCAKFCTDSIK